MLKRLSLCFVLVITAILVLSLLPAHNSAQRVAMIDREATKAGEAGNGALQVLDHIAPTAECATADKCEPGGDYYEACSGVGLTMWDTCRAAGGSKAQCEADAQMAQNNCMRDFGCPPIIF